MTIRTTHLPACAVLVAALALAPTVQAQQARTGDAAAPGTTMSTPSATAPSGTTTATTTPSATTTPAAPGARMGDEARTERRAEDGERRNEIVQFSALESGSNSFTEGQARSRMEDVGITNVGELRRDDRGFWVGRGTHGGSQTDVAMDFRGRIAVGTGIAAMSPAGSNNTAGTTAGTTNRSTTTGTGTTAPTASSTMAPSMSTGANDGRAAVGTTSAQPDGTPGNPPGTAATRALDRAAGTNTSGANPQNADGTANNPPGTAAGRALDRATGSNTTGANPQPGTTPTR
ncbi:hypothetical protein [Sabulicella glaciei]|uniref:Uncharacterized protein n=1 Tax=Sabulicella glaciei TaxID=2984948 RepID=A0ABT3P2V0_9PROT|nr:hypothetical protein [Roseococcus sp. MDT2-1-1]MCW8088104.1 hypothetical protein [Roseococcus sp. MDT2-1-1]